MRVLLTGGSGRLGTELQTLLPPLGCAIEAPSHVEMDVTDSDEVAKHIQAMVPDVVIHAAAFTDVSRAEDHPREAWRVNVEGTRVVALACRDAGVRLVHISTDYVFGGDRGGYKEDDPLGPPINMYALTKIVAEAVARCEPGVLVIRTSFRSRNWPHSTAFTDLRTSQDYVDVVAPEIALAIRHAAEVPFDTLHIVTEPKTSFELAKRRRPDVEPGSRFDVATPLPGDVTLDISRWQALRESFTSPE